MRHLAAILGVLAMLVALSGPAVALGATPSAGIPMGMVATSDGAAPCQTADQVCVSDCLAVGKCQHQCGSSASCKTADNACVSDCLVFGKCQQQCGSQAPFVSASPVDGLALLGADVVMVKVLPPPDAAFPVDSPPPRI